MASPDDSHVYSLHGIVLPKAQHKEVRRLRREGYEPSLHGNKVWRSSAVLMDYLNENPIRENARVVEIGCGWGGLATFMAKTFGSKVLAVDADPTLKPYVKLVTGLNDTRRVEFVPKRFEKITKSDFTGVHTLIGSEICFWDEMTRPLFRLIGRAFQSGVKQVLIADPGRTPFLDLVDMCDKKYRTEMFGHKIKQPWKTEKFIMRVRP